MGEFTVQMALVDLIPVVLFALSVRVILKATYTKMSAFVKILYIAGTSLVFIAGLIKAIYKLFAAFGRYYTWMNNQFFPNQAFGFLLAGIGMLVFAIRAEEVQQTYGFIPTMAYVVIMVGGLAMLDGGYCILACKLKKQSTIVFFIVSLILCMMMGYLSSRSFASASMNWIAQGINTFAQLFLFVGCRELEKAGLADL